MSFLKTGATATTFLTILMTEASIKHCFSIAQACLLTIAANATCWTAIALVRRRLATDWLQIVSDSRARLFGTLSVGLSCQSTGILLATLVINSKLDIISHTLESWQNCLIRQNCLARRIGA